MVASMAAGGVLAEDFDAFYVGSSVGAFMPDGAARPRSAALAVARVGWYSSDTLAYELEAGSSIRGKAGNLALGGVGVLWHWWGFERLDPFFTCRAAVAGRSCGPEAGTGFFWHLSETASLRADARMLLDATDGCVPLYCASLGVQFAF